MRTLSLGALLLATLPLLAACSSGGNGPTSGSGGATSSSTGDTTTGVGGASDTSSTGAGSSAGGGGSGGGGGGVAIDPTGTFVAVGYGGRRIRSTDDGVTWTDDVSIDPNGGDDLALLRTIAWGNGLFVAAGWRIMTSPDGVTWNDTPPDAFNQNWIGQMVYGGGAYVGLGGYGSRVTSPDAVAWAQHSIDTTASHPQGGVAFAKGKGFVSINDSGDVSHSADGATWVQSGANVQGGAHAVAYGNGIFLALSDVGVVTSADGEKWSAPTPFATMDVRSLLFAQGHFTAISPEHVYTSTDGATWADHDVKGLFIYHAGFGHGTYVAFDGTKTRRSTDGLVWSDPVDLGGNNSLERVVFGPK
jgi:hypothetical protein